MDDVATALGMSKRTLYELFGDKEELLYQSVIHLMDQRYANLAEQVQGCSNMIERLLKSVRLLISYGSVDEMGKRLAYNMKKFYPSVFERVQKVNYERSLSDLHYALDKCLEEGYIDPTVDVELMTRLFFMSMNAFVTDMQLSLPFGVTREEAFGAMVVNFLRGLSTVKGLQLIDEILLREPRPKTLQERRQELSGKEIN